MIQPASWIESGFRVHVQLGQIHFCAQLSWSLSNVKCIPRLQFVILSTVSVLVIHRSELSVSASIVTAYIYEDVGECSGNCILALVANFGWVQIELVSWYDKLLPDNTYLITALKSCMNIYFVLQVILYTVPCYRCHLVVSLVLFLRLACASMHTCTLLYLNYDPTLKHT